MRIFFVDQVFEIWSGVIHTISQSCSHSYSHSRLWLKRLGYPHHLLAFSRLIGAEQGPVQEGMQGGQPGAANVSPEQAER